MSQDKFEWSDSLVAEFTSWSLSKSPVFQGRYADIEQFKQKKIQEAPKTKRDWEILEGCADGGGIHEWYPDNTHGGDSCPSQRCKIHSVKRLSDGEVFSIGDEVEVDKKDEPKNWVGQITEFWITGGGDMHICYNGHHYDIKYFKKVIKPKPLFIAGGDGAVVYEGDSFYTVTDDFDVVYSDAVKGMRLTDAIISRSYYTRKAAEEYILLNKPLLSVNDVRNELMIEDDSPHSNYLVELAKSKLK